MKKVFTIIVALFLFSGTAFALDWTFPVAPKTAVAKIETGAGTLAGIAVATDGTNAVTFDIFDNTTNSGKKILPTFVVTTSATDRFKFIEMPGKSGAQFENGLYVSPTCAGTYEYTIYLGR